MRRCALLLGATIGCADGGPLMRIVLDVPPEGSQAYPFDGVKELELYVTQGGRKLPNAEQSVRVGEPLFVANVPYGYDLIVHLSGRNELSEIAYGRTCALNIENRQSVTQAPHLYFSRIVEWAQVNVPKFGPGCYAYNRPDGSAVFVGEQRRNQDGPMKVAVERFDAIEVGLFESLPIDLLVRKEAALSPLSGGKAVIVGGTDELGTLVDKVELLDADPGLAPTHQVTRHNGPEVRHHRATTLVDGSVLVTGGEVADPLGPGYEFTGKAWLFRLGPSGELEPARELERGLGHPRAEHSMTLLHHEDGADVLVAGGRGTTGTVAAIEFYRPLSQTFDSVGPRGNLITPRWNHSAVRLTGGRVLILGGLTISATPGSNPTPVAELEIYDPVPGEFRSAGVLPLMAGLTEHTVTTLPDGRILLVGGRSHAGVAVDTVLIARFDPINGRLDIIRTDQLSTPRAGHSAVLLCDGTVLIAGGMIDDSAAAAERYNPPPANRR